VKPLCYRINWQLSMLQAEKMHCVLPYTFAHNFIMSKRRVAKHAATYSSLVDVEEFRTGILEAGTQLASLFTVEYPSADLVSDALYGVTEVVEVFIMKGKLVTSWASSARNDFLVTSGIREVSGIVTFFDMTCKSCVVH
jgi:hypothetical protein